jgi:hypothetical protein
VYDAYDAPGPRLVQPWYIYSIHPPLEPGIDHQRGPDQFARHVLTSVKKLRCLTLHPVEMERVPRINLFAAVQLVTPNRDLWIQNRDPPSRFHSSKEFGVPIFRKESTRSSYSVVPLEIWWDTVGTRSGQRTYSSNAF